MPVGLRTAAAGFLSPVAAAALAFGFAEPVTAAVPAEPNPNCAVENKCTALMLGGTGTGTLTEQEMSEALGGYFADDAAYERLNVRYPGSWDFLSSIPIGSSLLIGEITTTEGPMVVGAFSQGASVANQAMVNLSLNSKAPPKDQLRFVLVADPNHSPSASKWLVPETPYDVIAVTQEYDGFADYPDRWWNTLATFNATLGGLYLHFETVDADLDTVPGDNITVTVNSLDGVTSHYLVPTETLPLVKFMPFLAPLEGWLKEQVDAGYSRNDGKAEAQALAVEADDTSTPVVEETVQASLRSASAVEAADESSAPVEAASTSSDGAAGVDEDTDELVDATDELSDDGTDGTEGGDVDIADELSDEDVDGTDGADSDDVDVADELSDEDVDVDGTEDVDGAEDGATGASANDASETGADSEASSSKSTSDNDSDSDS